MHTTRRITSGVVIVLLAAGCGGKAGTPSASRSRTTGNSADATSSPVTGAPTTQGTVHGPSLSGDQLTTALGPAGSAPLCSVSALGLTVEVQRGDQSIGQAVRRLVLRNDGAGVCAVRGYPAVSLLDAAFHPMPLRIHRTGAEVTSIQLSRGESAEALIEASEMPGRSGGCAPASVYVGVRLDGWARALTARGEVPRCGGDLRVNPLRRQ